MLRKKKVWAGRISLAFRLPPYTLLFIGARCRSGTWLGLSVPPSSIQDRSFYLYYFVLRSFRYHHAILQDSILRLLGECLLLCTSKDLLLTYLLEMIRRIVSHFWSRMVRPEASDNLPYSDVSRTFSTSKESSVMICTVLYS
ncbi:unnamed protein product [Dicrocoelium dendriticum]|nr:unnamed protein product [Dicrocoelium dendriticum]